MTAALPMNVQGRGLPAVLGPQRPRSGVGSNTCSGNSLASADARSERERATGIAGVPEHGETGSRAAGTLATPLRIWMAGLRIGAATIPREPVLGLKRLILPVGYWRTAEFAYVGRRLRLGPGAAVFDLGSPKDLAAMLARARRYAVVATDLLPDAVRRSERYARAQRLDGRAPGRVHSEVQDGRRLSYPGACFDGAFSVSVLEHIPEDGDTAAICELVRVVKPGGRIVVTVPYAARYRETWVDHDVYERPQVDERPVLFERHYDDEALRERLIRPSGARLDDLEIWGEGAVRMERLLARLGRAEVLSSPIQPLLSILCLRRLTTAGGHPMAAFLTLAR